MNQNKHFLLFLFFCFLLLTNTVKAQKDSAKPVTVVRLHYFNFNNKVQYLLLESMQKNGRVLTPQPDRNYEIFLDSSRGNNLISKVQTNKEGMAKAIIPPTLKEPWDRSARHTFIVREGDKEIISDYVITKAKVSIDTATIEGLKNITATVMKMDSNNLWIPVSQVEMKLGIKRMNSILSAGDEPTYSTDSTGTVTVELKKDSLPGDEKGNLVLAAKVEDNDELGNLRVEKTVPWGVVTKTDSGFFNQRTLWSTRFRTPFWLLWTVYCIIAGVWGTLIYLVFNLIKIGKLGKNAGI